MAQMVLIVVAVGNLALLVWSAIYDRHIPLFAKMLTPLILLASIVLSRTRARDGL